MNILFERIIFLIIFFGINFSKAQINSSSKIIFLDDFNNNQNNWTVADNKDESAKMDKGFYYLTAKRHAFGEMQNLSVDTKKDFEIETRIKILEGDSDHLNYYNMIFWGRGVSDGYYFTFAKDRYISVETCTKKTQSSCTILPGSLQQSRLIPDDFNVYKIIKSGNQYSFFINGNKIYEMPFAPFFGDMIGFGAGRKVTLQIDYFKVVYL